MVKFCPYVIRYLFLIPSTVRRSVFYIKIWNVPSDKYPSINDVWDLKSLSCFYSWRNSTCYPHPPPPVPHHHHHHHQSFQSPFSVSGLSHLVESVHVSCSQWSRLSGFLTPIRSTSVVRCVEFSRVISLARLWPLNFDVRTLMSIDSIIKLFLLVLPP